MPIHPTASVAPECELGEGVEIGPFCVLTGRVRLGPGVRLVGNVYLSGPCTIGAGTVLYPFVCIGFPGQDVKFKPGDPTAGVVIGARGILREHVTIHAATSVDTPTTVGDGVFMMVNTHLGHDARVGNNVVMVNNSAIGGHAQLHDSCTLGGGAMIHQFNRVGRLAFITGGAPVSCDVPPFCTVGERNRLSGLNVVGLRRAGVPRDQITVMRQAFREIFRNSLPKEEMIRALTDRGAECPPLLEMAEFAATARRPLCTGVGRPPRSVSAWLNNVRRGKVGLDFLADEQLEGA